MEPDDKPVQKELTKPKDDDFALSGILFTLILLIVLGFMVYILTIKSKSPVCVPGLDANGNITNNCTPSVISPAPAQSGSGQIQLLPGLHQQNLPQIDGQGQ